MILGNNVAKLYIGNQFKKYPPQKAVDGVLKSHLMIDNKSFGKQSITLRDYFFKLADVVNKKIKGIYY